MKIGIDLDGVLVDTYSTVLEYYKNKYSMESCPLIFPSHTKVTRYLSDILQIEEETAKEIWYSDMNHIFDISKSVTGAVDMINALTKNHQIYFISARPDLPGIMETTCRWLKKNSLSNFKDSLIINKESKFSIAEDLKLDFFIEDSPHQIQNLARNGVKVIIFNTRYNQEINPLNSYRVTSWNHINEVFNNTLIVQPM
ncbi:hypothetical protein ABE078_24260 [Priestia megaterium]